MCISTAGSLSENDIGLSIRKGNYSSEANFNNTLTSCFYGCKQLEFCTVLTYYSSISAQKGQKTALLSTDHFCRNQHFTFHKTDCATLPLQTSQENCRDVEAGNASMSQVGPHALPHISRHSSNCFSPLSAEKSTEL